MAVTIADSDHFIPLGGRLVTIAPESVSFRKDRNYQQFRNWLTDKTVLVDILAAVKRTAIPKPHDLGFGRELSRTVSASFPCGVPHLP